MGRVVSHIHEERLCLVPLLDELNPIVGKGMGAVEILWQIGRFQGDLIEVI